MIEEHLWLVLLGWMLGAASPGPATLAISATALGEGRRAALLFAGGVTCGSASWGMAAALGLSALMMANAGLIETVRWLGAAYLMWLALRSLRRALSPVPAVAAVPASGARLFSRGLLLHLTNPKAIFGWGAVFAVLLPADADSGTVWFSYAVLLSGSAVVFLALALLFSRPSVGAVYRRSQRWIDGLFAALFGGASLRFATLEITTGS